MPPLFYLIWYCAAAVVVVLVWARTARLHSRRGRLAIRLAAVAFGFTTVPLFGPDGGVWFPMGLYYLTGGSARLEAWGKATLVIAPVWLLLFVGVLGLGALWSAIRSR